MKRTISWESVDVLSSDESSSPPSISEIEVNKAFMSNIKVDARPREMTPEEAVTKRAEMYQEYMNQIPIPTLRGSIIPFTTWMGLGKSIKEMYGQPLHYLTNIQLKQWDRLRIGSPDEYRQLDTIIHPCKAEAVIWLMEEVHRRTSSHHYTAKLWLLDPIYHASIDSIFPQLSSS